MYDQDRQDTLRHALPCPTCGEPDRRTLPCPTCGEPDRLTPADRQRGYQCDACDDKDEDMQNLRVLRLLDIRSRSNMPPML